VETLSWGYLVDRAAKQFAIDLTAATGGLSRFLATNNNFQRKKQQQQLRPEIRRDADEWGYRKTSSLHIGGRIVLNVWRMVRGNNLALTSYSYHSVVWHVLHWRQPRFTAQTLGRWWTGGRNRFRVVRYYTEMTRNSLHILDELNCIGKTSEFASIYGVDFFSVISRGSQFKVESMMLRLARPENFVALSPTRRQVANQRAAECLPLVMEPRSGYYKAPVLVLDFQSLYPSIMIAYNYCFSTCLGRLTDLGGRLGVRDDYTIDAGELLGRLGPEWRKQVTIAPNGVVFLRPKVRVGLLRKLLIEILETRLMIKRSMGRYADRPSLHRQLDARQMGLKLLANVIYGYTSASFSGRMPCIDIADSIVQTGRETLEMVIIIPFL
jgi:DNA polymerase zeta